MLHSTFRLVKKILIYPESYHALAKHMGGVTKYGADTPFTLLDVLDVCGLDTCLWYFRCVVAGEEAERDRVLCLLMADYVEHVKHVYEDEYPGDTRISNVVDVLRRHAVGQATPEELEAVVSDAHDATQDAHAARAAAYAARAIAYATCIAIRAARATTYSAPAAASAGLSYVAVRAAEAAGVAGYAAEREWQTDRLRHYLIGERSVLSAANAAGISMVVSAPSARRNIWSRYLNPNTLQPAQCRRA